MSRDTFSQIVFPIPEICEYLTDETKVKLFTNAERDDQGSKVRFFFFLPRTVNMNLRDFR